MSTWRRTVFNLRRSFLLASIVVVALTLVGLGVIYALRSAGDVWEYLGRSLVVALGLFLVAVVCGLVGRPLPKRVVLELDLASMPEEAHGDNPLSMVLGGRSLTLREVVETIDRAAADSRVRVLLAYIGFDAAGLGSIQELRDAVVRFRSAAGGGKKAIAFADSFGQLGGGNGSYYLASAFDEVIVQPSGEVGLVGLYRDVNFVKRGLDKLGVEFHVEGRHEYKNAANQLVQTSFTPPHREALERVMVSQWDQIIDGIAAARGLRPDDVQAFADRGPLFAGDALAAGLIDRVGFRDDAVERAKEIAGPGCELRWLARYRRFAVRGGRGRPTIAVITGVGAIDRTKVPVNPLSPGGSIAADKVAASIRKAVADRKVRAIVLRVNSPGGSAVGSETMWREVVRAGDAGTPVVASMGDVAASGGYYMSMAASRIVAQPGTLTGSIGVVAQKAILGGAKDKLGLDVQSLSTAANAGIQSVNRDFLPSEQAAFSAWLDHIYDDFVGKVASGRKMSTDAVHEVARGRVWTGADAHERGLVDDLGGFDVALRHARSLAGLSEDAPVRVIDYPKMSRVAQLRAGAGRNSEDPRGVLTLLAPVLRALGVMRAPGVLHAGFDDADVLIR